MFKPVAMNKVNIFIKNTDLKNVTNVLYDFKLIEFFTINQEKFDRFEHEDLNDISAELLKLRSTITVLKGYFKTYDKKVSLNAIELTLKSKDELDKVTKEILFLEDEMKREKILSSLKLQDKDLTKYTIGFISESHENLLKKLDAKNIKYVKTSFEDRIYFATKSAKIDFPFKEFYLPKESLENISQKLKIAKDKLKLHENELVYIANNNLDHLEKEEIKLSKEIGVLEAKTKFSKTTNLCVLSGFVPKKQVSKLKHELEKVLADKFEIDVENVKDDEAPVKLENGFMSNKFEALLRMYSLPKYGEFDPTILMFLIFPIFFGFILGDVGYGLVSLIIFTIAKFKMKNIKDFLTILQFSAFVSILFGIFYGEYFGFEPYHIFSRAESPETLLLIAVIFGVIHINIGIIIGFINQIHDLKHAICDKLSWIIMEIAVAILALGIYVSSTTAIFVGSVFLLLSAVLIYMGHGFIGIIEIPSFFTNILSYARLMAVGLSSIAIAVLVNEYTLVLFSKGAIGIFAGVLLFTFGHIFNIVLGNFESFLHTLRLHYVEFFTKFYTGGGREFVPFGQKIREED